MTGTIVRGTAAPVNFQMRFEPPERIRIEEQGAPVAGFDGRDHWKAGATPQKSDRDLLETLVYDSAERFFVLQANGSATRRLGGPFRERNGAAYTGASYYLYQVVDQLQHGEPRAQTKVFLINSRSLELQRVRYHLPNGTRVETRYEGWRDVNGQWIPATATRLENGVQILRINLVAAATAARDLGPIFARPR